MQVGSRRRRKRILADHADAGDILYENMFREADEANIQWAVLGSLPETLTYLHALRRKGAAQMGECRRKLPHAPRGWPPTLVIGLWIMDPGRADYGLWIMDYG